MLQGMNPVNQKEVDQKMFDLDGSDNKGKLGANAILAVSMAACKVCLMHDSLPPSHRHANQPIMILLYHIMLSQISNLPLSARCHAEANRHVLTRSLHAVRLPNHAEEVTSVDAFVKAISNIDSLVVCATGWSCREGCASVQALGRPGWQCKAGNHSP